MTNQPTPRFLGRALRSPSAFALLLLACSATPDEGPTNFGSGVHGQPPPADTCQYELDRCDGCNGCLDRCLCLTQNTVECPIACNGGGEPPPPPPGSGGFGGQPPPNTGGVGGQPPPPPPPNTGGFGGSGNTGGGEPPPPATGGTTGGSPCTYPPGPYGTKVGSVIAPSLSWQGFKEGSGSPTTLTAQDYFDCDGTRGIHAVLLVQSAVWCGACKSEAAKYNSKMKNGWQQKGIRILTLMIENAYGQPATIATAQGWKDSYSDGSWAVVADPNFTFRTQGSNGLPTSLILDPRTMKIIDRKEGSANSYKLENLAGVNKVN